MNAETRIDQIVDSREVESFLHVVVRKSLLHPTVRTLMSTSIMHMKDPTYSVDSSEVWFIDHSSQNIDLSFSDMDSEIVKSHDLVIHF